MHSRFNPFERPAEPQDDDTDWAGWIALGAVLLLAVGPLALEQLLR